jgi:hypothetical protein
VFKYDQGQNLTDFVRYLLGEVKKSSFERFCLVLVLLPVDKIRKRGNV